MLNKFSPKADPGGPPFVRLRKINQIKSNALEKSIHTAPVKPLLPSVFFQFLIKDKRAY